MNSPLEQIKMHAMEANIDRILTEATKHNLDVLETLEQLFEQQSRSVVESRMERRIRESKLPERKLLADFDFAFQTGVDKAQIMNLNTLGFVEQGHGLIFAGSSGTGKSHLAKALMLTACQKLYRCRYTTASDMLSDLLSGLADDSLDQKLKSYTRPQVLLIDEVGFDRLEQESARNASLFFKVVNARYTKLSTWITTNIDFKALGDYLGDPVVTTAIVDRLVHHALIIHIDGPSWRLHESNKLNQSGNPKKRRKT